MRFRNIFIISTIVASTIVHTTVAAGSCAIDGQLTPKLAEYVRGVNELASTLKQLPSSCGGRSSGVVSGGRRTIDVIDKAKAENTVMNDLWLDFDYNISSAFKGESRSAVVQNGKIFGQVEKTLASTLDVLATRCNIDAPYEGTTPEQIIIAAIRVNDALESLYKDTAMGYPGKNVNIPDEYQDIATEIRTNYNPTATQGCKNQYSFEDMSETIMNKIGGISFNIDKSLTNWKYAIALIRGGDSMKQEEYSALKKKLLTEELRRQGYSAGAIDQMVKGYSCMESAMGGDTPMDFAQAKVTCSQKSILGAERFAREWSKMLLGSKGARTIVGYINRSKAKNSVDAINVNTVTVFNSIQSIFAEDTPTNDEMLTKFINLHITLLDVNDRIEKRIPIMLANCRKAQPSIPCNF